MNMEKHGNFVVEVLVLPFELTFKGIKALVGVTKKAIAGRNHYKPTGLECCKLLVDALKGVK